MILLPKPLMGSSQTEAEQEAQAKEQRLLLDKAYRHLLDQGFGQGRQGLGPQHGGPPQEPVRDSGAIGPGPPQGQYHLEVANAAVLRGGEEQGNATASYCTRPTSSSSSGAGPPPW